MRIRGTTTEKTSTVDALQVRVDSVEAAIKAGEFSTAMRLISENLAETWYSFRPERLRVILVSIIDAGADDAGLARALHSVVAPGQGQRLSGAEVSHALTRTDAPVESISQLARAFELRLRGRAGDALRILDTLDRQIHDVQTLFDTRGGWDLLISLQCGITAMLAGEFKRALTYFTFAQLHPVVPSLAFLTRDAYVSAAMVHGAFGDSSDARNALEQADRIPRTSSWAEALIDAKVSLVRALTSSGHGSMELIDSVPLQDIGEMWPFYAIALRRVLGHSGRRRELEDRVAILEQLPFPREPGEGLTGSVFPAIRAGLNLARGDVVSAQRFLDAADPECVETQASVLILELTAGRSRRALREAQRLGRNPRAAALRLVDVWRYSGLTQAYLALDQVEEAVEALRTAAALPGGIRVEDLRFFTRAARDLAAERITGWPESDIPSLVEADPVVPSARLTQREFEIVQALAQDLTRAEIAGRLFVSVNTLKGHLKAIYKKLGVASRDEAVLRAEREGWV